jgi:hypothetical protein
VNQRLQLFQLSALGPIGNRLFIRPAGRRNALTQIRQIAVRNVDLKRADGLVSSVATALAGSDEVSMTATAAATNANFIFTSSNEGMLDIIGN